MTKTFRMCVTCLLAFSPSLFAENACTSETITGQYCYRVSGFADYGSGAGLIPTASLGTATLQRTGPNTIAVSIGWSQTVGGTVFKLTGTGAVTVERDCTGTGSFTVNEQHLLIAFEFVVLDDGNEIRMMPVSPPGLVLTAEFKRMSAGRDEVEKSGTLAPPQRSEKQQLAVGRLPDRKAHRQENISRGNLRLTADYLGGVYTLSGSFPGMTAHAQIANEILASLNQTYNTRFELVDLSKVAPKDPAVRFRPVLLQNVTK